MKKRVQVFAAVLALQLGGLAAAPALAGDAEVALLNSYIGSWQGEGALVGGERPDPLRCRLTVAKGNQGKLNYSGRCTLVKTNLSVSGTIAYNDSAGRYEAAMSSNAGFTGTAIGRQQGDRITFDLKEQKKDAGGSDVRIGSKIYLISDTIRVDFEVEFNNSGQVLTAAVPFSR